MGSKLVTLEIGAAAGGAHSGKPVTVCQFSYTGDRIMSAGDDHSVRLWTLAGEPVAMWLQEGLRPTAVSMNRSATKVTRSAGVYKLRAHHSIACCVCPSFSDHCR